MQLAAPNPTVTAASVVFASYPVWESPCFNPPIVIIVVTCFPLFPIVSSYFPWISSKNHPFVQHFWTQPPSPSCTAARHLDALPGRDARSAAGLTPPWLQNPCPRPLWDVAQPRAARHLSWWVGEIIINKLKYNHYIYSYIYIHIYIYTYIHVYIHIHIYTYIWAIVKTLGSRKRHPQIWEGPIAYHTFVQ